ncbi:translation initiation factor IF-2 [Candidatus Fermentibacteria bacterium]|nr:MAG: translation initiation factor IF-2 [Candidatus Fermentibacteria bacterium]
MTEKKTVRKQRVYELARELNISSEALLKVLAELEIPAKSHMSTLAPADTSRVINQFEKQKNEAKTRATRKRKRRRRKKKTVVSAETVKNVKKTLAKMDAGKSKSRKSRKTRYRREKQERHEQKAVQPGEDKVVNIAEFTSPAELSAQIGIPVNSVIATCMGLGVMATANQRLDSDTIALVAEEYDFKVREVAEFGAEALEEARVATGDSEAEERPPVVTIMGHVDHGKTALLDRIRSSNVISTESGGITQHIGAYVATVDDDRQITFIDTPGHAAFTAMRARGAMVTDIVVLVVAADSRVMPQTKESIEHARAAGIPIIVAITKMDLPTANPDFIKQDLSANNVLVEEWSGNVQCAQVSAMTGEGIDDLLEKILLQAELMELTAVPDRLAKGTVLEGRVDPRRGSIVNILVQDGTLREGDFFVAGQFAGRARALFDENDEEVSEVPPGYPVQLLGSPGVPGAGDSFVSVENESEAKKVALRRQIVERERVLHARRKVSLEDFWASSEEGERVLNIIVKSDVSGSAEAIVDTLSKLQNEEVGVSVILSGAGGITESDVDLASASNAVILGFKVRPDQRAREKAAEEGVEISTFNVIYDLENTVKKALGGLLKPEEKEEFLGSAEVRDTFKVPKIGVIAGSYIVAGKIKRNARARLVRNGVVLWEGEISSLKHFKEDRREMVAGFECGIGLEKYNDIKVGDTIESFQIVKIARELE